MTTRPAEPEDALAYSSSDGESDTSLPGGEGFAIVPLFSGALPYGIFKHDFFVFEFCARVPTSCDRGQGRAVTAAGRAAAHGFLARRRTS